MNVPRTLKHAPIRDDDVERKRREIAEGRADIAAGRVHSHEEVKAWAKSIAREAKPRKARRAAR
jgi:predicted transcriptional regulator